MTGWPGHFLERCEHGTVVRQCRCPGPKAEKIVPCPFGHEPLPKATAVHNHGPEEGPGVSCPERLVGACLGWIDADILGMALDRVDEEDAQRGVVGRGRKVDRVIAAYERIKRP